MFHLPARRARPVVAGVLALSLTAAAAVAGTIHTFAVSQTTGSEGAVDFLQTTVPGGALQGEVGSAASTGLGTPFGMFGKYGPPSGTTTKGIGAVGISTLGWGVVGENLGGGPALYAFPNSKDGVGLDAEADNEEAIYAEAHNAADNVDGADIYADGYGSGVYAYSQKGNGVVGTGAVGDGVEGNASSGGDGVYGQSDSGYGVHGFSSNGDGVHGEINNSNSGVAGINDGSGGGVYGSSVSGAGVSAFDLATPSPAPTGAYFQYASSFGQSLSGSGVYGVNVHNTEPVAYSSVYNDYTGVSGLSTDGAGVYGYSKNDAGVIAESGGENPALGIDLDSSTGYEIIAASKGGYSSDSNFNFSVNGSGNEYVGGTVTSGGGTFNVTKNPHADTVTYGAEATEPMVEDVGSAHLVNGAAAVPLTGDFRQTIQDGTRYLVFITPEGDSKGLYVTQKSPAGFVVREAQGGRSTMDFDYRIVAQRYGVQTGRLPHLAALAPDIAKMRLSALQQPITSTTATGSSRRSAMVMPPVRKISTGTALQARARFAADAAHRRMTRPPAPPPGFLAGVGIHN